jgi:hypothetical protein
MGVGSVSPAASAVNPSNGQVECVFEFGPQPINPTPEGKHPTEPGDKSVQRYLRASDHGSNQTHRSKRIPAVRSPRWFDG